MAFTLFPHIRRKEEWSRGNGCEGVRAQVQPPYQARPANMSNGLGTDFAAGGRENNTSKPVLAMLGMTKNRVSPLHPQDLYNPHTLSTLFSIATYS